MAVNDHGLRSAMEGYHTRSAEHASIYVRHLTVGPEFDNLTIDQARNLAVMARQYANIEPDKWQQASRIDKALYGSAWQSAHSQQGYRALITNSDNKVSSLKQRVMLTWADAVEKLARQAEDAGQARVRSLYYVGYAMDAHVREKQHMKNDHHSNLLIRFAHAVLMASDWFTERPVTVKTSAICLLSDEEGAAIAEALLARAMCAYHFHGGFNIQPCGASVASAYGRNWSPEQKEEYWSGARKWLDTMTFYEQYRDDEHKRREVLQRQDWEAEKKALVDEHTKHQERKAALRAERDAIRGDMDWETLRNHPFLSEYADMFAELDELAGPAAK
ncbi:hypothetical protein EKO04_002982 [Ascochyta lentis]|uniref:Uncharacterized protein n=1 Tax=Ascochyta lentis TaxID=205686 RepID=A0A8H7J8U9_9PLEO|nr:hypothetical protein EKO04_002982 [Ascochyta lentis]